MTNCYATMMMGIQFGFPRYAIMLECDGHKYVTYYSVNNPWTHQKMAANAEHDLWMRIHKEAPKTFVECCDRGWVPEKLQYLKETV